VVRDVVFTATKQSEWRNIRTRVILKTNSVSITEMNCWIFFSKSSWIILYKNQKSETVNDIAWSTNHQ
jgi:hypothetical protein